MYKYVNKHWNLTNNFYLHFICPLIGYYLLVSYKCPPSVHVGYIKTNRILLTGQDDLLLWQIPRNLLHALSQTTNDTSWPLLNRSVALAEANQIFLRIWITLTSLFSTCRLYRENMYKYENKHWNLTNNWVEGRCLLNVKYCYHNIIMIKSMKQQTACSPCIHRKVSDDNWASLDGRLEWDHQRWEVQSRPSLQDIHLSDGVHSPCAS